MIVSICTLAKRENAYINDWIAYHLGIGYDRIYIYDNNDADYPLLAEAINPQLRDSVVIEDWRGREFPAIPNVQVYDDWLLRHAGETDWCSFIDVDEFVHLESGNIKTFLQPVPSWINFVILNWRLFGDDEIIVGDESVPVYERLHVIKNNLWLSQLYKTTMRCSCEARAVTPHSFQEKLHDVTAYIIPTMIDSDFCCRSYDALRLLEPQAVLDGYRNYIAHYMTKTLAEFLKYKCERVCPSYGFANKIDYYFMINERTPEKEAYIQEFYKNQNL
ncbi:MAG: glycosyltransferase family 2 protein [Salinivirgaceae bacterium]|nr:glycosyltransferase family 2 protein [Salinivirgaceae bacterium]